MNYKTIRLITLHTLKYSESSLLVYAYTDLFGRQTYLLRGVRSAKNHSAAAHFFPLNMLDAEVYHKPSANIQHIKEFHTAHPLNNIRANLNKSAIALFLGELLYKSIKEEEANDSLFRFLAESIHTLNDLTCSVANFHLYFLVQFCTRLGIAPLPNYHPDHAPHFDVTQGLFVPPDPRSDSLFSREESLLFAQLSALPSAAQAASIPLNGAQRHQFVLQIIRYLHYHLGVSLEIKSPEVLRQLF